MKTTKLRSFRDIWLDMEVKDRRAMAKRINTSYAYLQALSGGFKMPSLRFAAKLAAELPSLDITGFARTAADAGKRMPQSYDRAFKQAARR